jgi:protein-S-isoprenylcysteine O-methyltransferase Ste14
VPPITNWMMATTCLVLLGMHAYASKTRFRVQGQIPFRMKVLGLSFVVGLGVNVSALARARMSAASTAEAGVMYGLSLWLFLAACRVNRQRPLTVAFSHDVPQHLVRVGPYRYVRHPFYGAYCVTWLAGATAAHSVPLLLWSFVMAIQYAQAARLEERKFAKSSMADVYRDYCRQAGMFLPRCKTIWRHSVLRVLGAMYPLE